MSMTLTVNLTNIFSTEVDSQAGQYVDGCEACLTPTRGWYLRPVATVDDGKSVVAHYAHQRCGRRWTTAWLKEEAPSVGIHGSAEPSHIGVTLREIFDHPTATDGQI